MGLILPLQCPIGKPQSPIIKLWLKCKRSIILTRQFNLPSCLGLWQFAKGLERAFKKIGVWFQATFVWNTYVGYNPVSNPKIADGCRRVLANPAAAQGNLCKTLGDVIIALQTPTAAVLWSTDAAYDVICPTLGIAHVREPLVTQTS